MSAIFATGRIKLNASCMVLVMLGFFYYFIYIR